MEVQFGRNVYMTTAAAEKAAAVAGKEDVALSVHAPYYVNLTSKSEQTRAKSRDWILASARIAAALGASMVTIHAARAVEPAAVVESFRGLTRQLKGEKITVPLGLETMGDEGEFGSLEEVLEVVRKVKGTAAVLDFAHLYSRSGGALRTADDFTAVFDAVDKVTKSPYHIHFSGIEHKNCREVRHVPLGAAGPDLGELVKALGGRKRDATIICESPLLEEDALKIRSALERSGAKPARGIRKEYK